MGGCGLHSGCFKSHGFHSPAYGAGEIETRSIKRFRVVCPSLLLHFKSPIWGQKGTCSGDMGYKFASSTETITFLSEKVK